jgi:small GTP-binding protein
MTKVIETEKHRIRLQLWDTAGQELFRSVTRGYYRGAAGAFVIFDLSNHDTFDHIVRWLQDVREVARADVVTRLVGNKVNLADKRDVTRKEAEALAKPNKMVYFEKSAKTGEQLGEAIDEIVAVIEKSLADGIYDVTRSQRPQQFLELEPERKGCSC